MYGFILDNEEIKMKARMEWTWQVMVVPKWIHWEWNASCKVEKKREKMLLITLCQEERARYRNKLVLSVIHIAATAQTGPRSWEHGIQFMQLMWDTGNGQMHLQHYHQVMH